tara:strand:+ start:110167 stop:110682 length:516 start_codon:yes stop_codon:yes gene_type:complete
MTGAEKLMMLMLAEIHEATVKSGEIDTKLIKSAVINRHEWALAWEYANFISDEELSTPEYVHETSGILTAWLVIENSYQRLSNEEKKEVDAVYGRKPVFGGFDGNNESEHYSAALFLIDDLHRFALFKGRDINSHMISLQKHKAIQERYKPFAANLHSGVLNKNALIEILQ